MNKPIIANGTVHTVPDDMREALIAHDGSVEAWGSLTPLARNEFICWVEHAKLVETRNKRIMRTATEITEGRRRPCCWIGCIHRTDKAISPSVKGILETTRRKP